LREWLVNGPGSSSLAPHRFRLWLLRWRGARIGQCVVSFGGVYYGDLSRLEIQDGAFLNAEVALYPSGGIVIGRNVAVGPRTLIMTGTHLVGTGAKRASTPALYRPVVIEDGAWIGGGVIIQGGVTIGHGAVIAAGAVVTGDVEPDSFYAGVPAVHKKYFGSADTVHRQETSE
jgi:maltose O-acetyltransferase